MKGATRFRSADWAVCSLIVALGVLQFMLPQKGSEFVHGDTVYIEIARSILERGTYRLDFNDVMYPPGLPALLALLWAMLGDSHEILVRSMALFEVLALLAAYDLLRREAGRAAAATICLLLASSPDLFAFSTQWVYSDLPFFFTSMATLLVAHRLERADKPRTRVVLGVLCAILLLCSLLLRSSGVALLAGMGAWLAIASALGEATTRGRRLKAFAGALLVGVVFQAAWMAWVATHETVEWPMLDGHPRTYLSQFKVKSGVTPELGTASVTDVIARVPTNLAARALGLAELVTHHYVDPAWHSPPVLGAVLLIALGLGASLRPAGGGPAEWYFMAHEAMYLTWPWPFETRFLIPVAPLACLYLWRGAAVVLRTFTQAPRTLALVGMPIGLAAGAAALVSAAGTSSAQAKLAVVVWSIVVALSAALLARPGAVARLATTPWWSNRSTRMPLARTTVAVIVAGLFAWGVRQQLDIGQENLAFDVKAHALYGRVLAARWIDQHTAGSSVVMARQLDVIHHHANRKVVWFAPLSDSKTLMDGIERLQADYVLATNFWNYYLPSEDDSVAALVKRYPQALRIVHEEANCRVYEVVRANPPTADLH